MTCPLSQTRKHDMRHGPYMTGPVTSRKCFVCGETEYYHGSQRVYFGWELQSKIDAATAATRDRLQTIVDEQIGPLPTLSAEELITKIETALAQHRTQLAERDAEVARLQATISGVQFALCLDTGKGVVSQCEHIKDAIDELQNSRRNLKAECQRLREALAGLMWRFEDDDEDPNGDSETAPDILIARQAINSQSLACGHSINSAQSNAAGDVVCLECGKNLTE